MILSFLFWSIMSVFGIRWLFENHEFKDKHENETLTNMDVIYIGFFVAVYVFIIDVLSIGTMVLIQKLFEDISVSMG